MGRIEAPAFCESSRQQRLLAPVATAPVFDSTPTSNTAGRDASAAENVKLFLTGPLGGIIAVFPRDNPEEEGP